MSGVRGGDTWVEAMTSLASVFVVPLATCLAFVAFAYWRGCVQRRAVHATRLWVIALFVQFALAIPAGCAGEEISRLLDPGDDWYDVYGLLIGFVNLIAAPFVACAVGIAAYWCDRRHRYPPGHCRRCGYDLTGNVSGTCPECGGPALTAPDRTVPFTVAVRGLQRLHR